MLERQAQQWFFTGGIDMKAALARVMQIPHEPGYFPTEFD